ncbi:hypothetical protein CHUAL_002893 [Chamberlinius hualienensis]
MAAVTNQEGKQKDDSNDEETVICLVGEDLPNDSALSEALKKFEDEVTVEYSLDGSEYIQREDLSNIKFVLSQFYGQIYADIRKVTSKIFSPVIIKQCAQSDISLPKTTRPLYCNFMNNVVCCFTGFKTKEELNKIIELIHHMGGSTRRDFSTSVTHLIANSTSGEKYKYGVNLGRPIMSPDWVFRCWEYRNDMNFNLSFISEAEYRVPPFRSCKIAFCGFPTEEQAHMEEMTVTNGGIFCSLDDPDLTHVVMEENCDSQVEVSKLPVYIVKVEWFWISIQINARGSEKLYKFNMTNENCLSNNVTPQSLTTGSTRAKKRKRLKETLGHLASLGDLDSANLSYLNTSGVKQRRSEDDRTLMSCSPSLIDTTMSPTSSDENVDPENPEKLAANSSMWSQSDLKSVSPRMQVAWELLQTECNYVGILHTIITLVKEPIEDVKQAGGPLLDPTEVKIIFGNVRPIYDVHVKLRDDLMELVNSRREDRCIGQVIVKYSQELLKAYPPFVNFFEKTKEMLLKCDATKPRFHAFLKICQGKHEFGRQSLVELLIRPVQRLPSIILLLGDILKHTSKSNPDHAGLEEAIKCLRDVLVNINEDKRKTEGQLAMFRLVNDIENCPPNLLSSHRHFITSADAVELGNGLSGKGDPLTLFLFTDVLEICKRRKCGTSSTNVSSSTPTNTVVRSASVVSLQSAKSYQKRYKHIEMLPLPHIKMVADVNETEECRNVFALICRGNQDLKERLYSFTLILDEQEIRNDGKQLFLQAVCRNLANVLCRQDADTFLRCVDPEYLDINGDVSTNTLSKAARFASKTSKRVGRVLSFTSKTPRKLTRAVSTMLSPLAKMSADSPSQDPFVTPLALSSRRLPCGSTLSLQNCDSPSSRKVLPSPSIGKKIKSFTLGPSSLMKRTSIFR